MPARLQNQMERIQFVHTMFHGFRRFQRDENQLFGVLCFASFDQCTNRPRQNCHLLIRVLGELCGFQGFVGYPLHIPIQRISRHRRQRLAAKPRT